MSIRMFPADLTSAINRDSRGRETVISYLPSNPLWEACHQLDPGHFIQLALYRRLWYFFLASLYCVVQY